MAAFRYYTTLASSLPHRTPLTHIALDGEWACTVLSSLTYIAFSCEWVSWIKTWCAWAAACGCWGLGALFARLQRHNGHLFALDFPLYNSLKTHLKGSWFYVLFCLCFVFCFTFLQQGSHSYHGIFVPEKEKVSRSLICKVKKPRQFVRHGTKLSKTQGRHIDLVSFEDWACILNAK